MTMGVEIIDIANRFASHRVDLSTREPFSKHITVEIENTSCSLDVQAKRTRTSASCDGNLIGAPGSRNRLHGRTGEIALFHGDIEVGCIDTGHRLSKSNLESNCGCHCRP